MSNYPACQLAHPSPKIATSFTRDELLSFNDSSLRPTCSIISNLRKCRLLRKGVHRCHHYRGCRAGRKTVSFERHSRSATRKANFGLLNIRSINNKVEDLLNLQIEQRIDVLFLTETWHDDDSICFKRLLLQGYSVVDCPRPRVHGDSLRCNHGGVAIVTVPGFQLKRLKLTLAPTSFEYVGGRVTIGSYSCTAVVIYRTGVISEIFFSEFSDLLDRISVLNEDVVVSGDFNIRLDRVDDVNSQIFGSILTDHVFAQHVDRPTHEKGGVLDAVAIRSSSPAPFIETINTGFSDHFLLRWASTMMRPPPVYKTSLRRCWRIFNLDAFLEQLRTSSLVCDAVNDLNVAVDEYNTELSAILDRQLPLKLTRSRARPSDPWFDDDLREAKKKTRRFERIAIRTSRPDDISRWKRQHSDYRKLLRQKREGFWKAKLESERNSSRDLWISLNSIMARGRASANNSITADKFLQYFATKVENVRALTSMCQPPSLPTTTTAATTTTTLSNFEPTGLEEVVNLINSLPNKQCSLDPIPTWLLKKAAPILAPFLVNLFNKSLADGMLPQSFKTSYITPILKKPNLDANDTSSYRPISNLSVISKLLEKLVLARITRHLQDNNLFPTYQSAYRQFHSTETAVLRVFSDVLGAADKGKLTLLVLLDLSAAFDTVDHQILLQRLASSFGFDGVSLSWFHAYLTKRECQVRVHGTASSTSTLTCGVPQGSVLGPTLFIMYIAELEQIVMRRGLQSHFYADDTQIYGHCDPDKVAELSSLVSACVDDVSQWMRSSRLQLNSNKSEAIWFSTRRRKNKRPKDLIRLGVDWISPSDTVRNLGAFLDSDMSMGAHVSHVTRACFSTLRHIKSVASSLSPKSLNTLVTSLVFSKLDYCNSVLAGLPKFLIRRLQSVMNAAARLVVRARKYDRISPILQELHWLTVDRRINFKLALLVFKCLHESAPIYLRSDITRVSDVPARRRLRSSSSTSLLNPASRLKNAGDRSFAVTGPRIWNCLPPKVTTATTTEHFRKALKTHMFVA